MACGYRRRNAASSTRGGFPITAHNCAEGTRNDTKSHKDPAVINVLEGKPFNAAPTDIRPEDALFEENRVLAP